MTVKYANSASAHTKKLIRDQFIQLLHEKNSIDKVNVTELVARAQISRSTFYAHYNSVAAVADDLRDETLKEFFQKVEVQRPEDVDNYFQQIFNYVKANDDFLRLLMSSTQVVTMALHMSDIYKRKLYELLENEPQITNKRLLEVEIGTVCDGLVMQLIRYYRGESTANLEDIVSCAKTAYHHLWQRRCRQ